MRIYYCQVSSHLDNYLGNLDNQRGQMKEGQSHVQRVHNMEINIRRRRGGEGEEGAGIESRRERERGGERARERRERGERGTRGRERGERGEREERAGREERETEREREGLTESCYTRIEVLGTNACRTACP